MHWGDQSELQIASIYHSFMKYSPKSQASILSLSTTNRENPVAAVFLSWAMVELFLLMGSLNQIAQLREP